MLGFLSVFIGGGIGSTLRWLLISKVNSHWGTILVNIIGAFLIGCTYQYFLTRTDIKSETRLLINAGLLGGFTTFSTYLLDFAVLLNKNEMFEAFLYLLLSVIVGIIFLFAGIKLVQVVF